MITLYHGSYMSVPVPLVKLGRRKVDFGQGFCLARLRRQAESWAETTAERKGRNAKPTLSACSPDYEAVKSDGYRVRIFESYDLDWLDYVVDCRKGGAQQSRYDMIEGGVADDNVIDTVEDYGERHCHRGAGAGTAEIQGRKPSDLHGSPSNLVQPQSKIY